MQTDAQLLRRYLDAHDEAAFSELVHRQLGLVYAAALRRCGGRAALAEEVAQQVFSALARKAAPLAEHPSLTGWLYRTTRYVAIDVLRAEQRRERLAATLTMMQDDQVNPGQQADWEKLRPLIDEAMDKLRESDRELMLLRFFEGHSFAELGERFQIAENTARMRTERALEKLRVQLGRRGLSSSTAALGLLLANQAFCSAPQGLASTISTAALAKAQAAAATSLLSLLIMSKFTAPGLTALAAAALTLASWNALAGDAGDDVEAAKLVWFDPKERARAEEILASMPESIRAQYRTPEHFYGFLFVADALVAPPPGADLLERYEPLEVQPGRMGLCRPGTKSFFHQYQQTPEGWKFVVPMAGVENAPQVLQNETLLRLSTDPKP